MKPTGAIWGFVLAGLPIIILVIPQLQSNGVLTAAVAAAALGILNALLKLIQETYAPTAPLEPTHSPQSRALGIPPPPQKQESLLKRVLLG